MIPRDYINAWRERAPWNEDFQVEQDLVISRALVEIFSDPFLADALAFRGGTALYKLYLRPPARYSEDIDLIQVEPGPAGTLMDRLRSALDPWLGPAQWKQSRGRVTFGYRFWSEDVPAMRLRLKVEINTREHFAVLGITKRAFRVDSRWYTGTTDIATFELDELLATKLRALFERNLAAKLRNPQFSADMSALARPGFDWKPLEAGRTVAQRLIRLLPGEPWKENTEA